MAPTTICHVTSTGAGSSTVVTTSLTGTAATLVLLLVLALLTQKSQFFFTVKGQFRVTMFLVFAPVKEGRDQAEQTAVSMLANGRTRLIQLTTPNPTPII